MNLTTDQLKQAYETHHKKEWPSFEQCLEHPIYSRILRIKVMMETMEANDHIFDSSSRPATHSISCLCPPCVAAFRKKHDQMDQKRLASGEKPD